MIKLMALVFIAISMEPNMKDTGKKISNMETAWRLGPMERSIKDNMYKARSMVKEDSLGLTEALTMESS